MAIKLTEEERIRRKKESTRRYNQRPDVKERKRKYQQQPEIRARRREQMREYNQRPDVIARRRDYYDNVALPRMCGLEPYAFPRGEKK